MATITWDSIMEHEALIRKCASSMTKVYGVDFCELYDHMCLALYEKSCKLPTLLSKGNGYIYTVLKNEVRSWMRRGANEKTFADTSAGEVIQSQGGESVEDVIAETITDKALAFTLEHMDEECRELVGAILEGYDEMTAGARKGNGISVMALAAKLGRPKSSVYRDMERVRAKLAPVMAIA